MNFADLFRFAWQALIQNRRRSGLSLIGVVVGVVAVVSLTAIGEGALHYVTDQFVSLGTSIVIVSPGRNETTGGIPLGIGGVPNDLTLQDTIAIERRIQSIRTAVPISLSTDSIEHAERSRLVSIIGVSSEFMRLQRLDLAMGRFLPESDRDRGSAVVVLGRTVAREIFGVENPLGAAVRVGGWRMRVIGVLAERGRKLGIQIDESIYVPTATAMRMANTRSVSQIMLELFPKVDPDLAIDEIKALLIERHDEEDFTCISQDAVMASLSSILRMLTLAVAGIAAVSLAVAGIGIMNVMLVSVSERTDEVGLLKAVGANRRQILALFLVEAALLSSVGGLLGLAVGTALVALGNQLYPSVVLVTPLWAIGSVLLITLGTGVVFGVLPARRAAALDPVLALRGR